MQTLSTLPSHLKRIAAKAPMVDKNGKRYRNGVSEVNAHEAEGGTPHQNSTQQNNPFQQPQGGWDKMTGELKGILPNMKELLSILTLHRPTLIREEVKESSAIIY